MTTTLGLLAGQLVLAALGYALLRGLGVASLRRGDLKLLGLSYFTGWAAMGVLASFGLMLGAGESLPLLLAIAGAAIALCLWLGRSAKPPPMPRVVQSREPLAVAAEASSWALIGIAATSAAVVSAKSGWNATRDFDAFNFWIPKAAVIYTSHGLDAELWRTFPHPEYPPLAPASDAYTFFFAGLHPSLLPTQRTLLGISFLFSLFVLLGRWAPRWVLLPFLAALATATWFWGELGWVMVDLPVACLVAGAATTGFLWLAERRRGVARPHLDLRRCGLPHQVRGLLLRGAPRGHDPRRSGSELRAAGASRRMATPRPGVHPRLAALAEPSRPPDLELERLPPQRRLSTRTSCQSAPSASAGRSRPSGSRSGHSPATRWAHTAPRSSGSCSCSRGSACSFSPGGEHALLPSRRLSGSWQRSAGWRSSTGSAARPSTSTSRSRSTASPPRSS